MPRTQLNIDCEPDERKAWKTTAVQEGKSLASWVREMLNLAAGNKPKPKGK